MLSSEGERGRRRMAGRGKCVAVDCANQAERGSRLCFFSCLIQRGALRLQDEHFFACALRYEELVQQRLALVKRLLECCGIAAEVQPAIESIFEKDSQMGSRIASKPQHYLRPADERRIRGLIALHERIREPGFILPGTL